MIRALFVGNFLSSHSGTKGVSEKIFDHFKHENGLRMHLVSRQGNKLLRFLEILLFASKYEYDVLHIDVFSGRAFYIARATARIARIRGKRILMTLRGGRLAEYTDAKPQLVLRTLRMASVVTTPSHFLRSYFSKRGLPVTYLPNTIDLTRFPYAKIEIGVHSPRLLWVRAFADIYNPVLAIRVLKTVLQYFPNALLTMIGPDKGVLSEVKSVVRDLGISSHVNFVGPIDNSLLYKYFHTHHVYLNTTAYESFGVAVLEAASCGLPVVSFDVGEIPYLWQNEESIMMAPYGDVESMAQQAVRLLNDAELHAKISKNARVIAEGFAWERVRPHWLKLLAVQNG